RFPIPGQKVVKASCGVGALVSGDRRYEATSIGVTAADISVEKGPDGTVATCSQPGIFEVAVLAPTGTHFDSAECYYAPCGAADSAVRVRFELPANTA